MIGAKRIRLCLSDLFHQDVVEMIERETRRYQFWSIEQPEHPDFVQVHLTVLEHVQTGDENYVHAMVDISDNRSGFGVGSAYRSLCGGMAFHADGRVEIFPPKGRE